MILISHHKHHSPHPHPEENPNPSVQFSSVAQSCPTLCNPMNRSTPGLPVHHQFPEFTQTHAHWVDDAIQPSHSLASPSPPTPNPSQNQGLFQWLNSSHKVAKVLEFQLQHQSFQWTPRTDLNLGIEPRSPALQVDFLPSEPLGKPENTGVVSLSLLQGIFPTQESRWCLLHCRRILYQLSYQGSSI